MAPVMISWKAEDHGWSFFALTVNDFSVPVPLRPSRQQSFELPISCTNTDVEQEQHDGSILFIFLKAQFWHLQNTCMTNWAEFWLSNVAW